ncbi:MAG: Gfo/Idh/MocA family oxidoreductase [Armatimonadia bacterium]
MSCEQVGFGVIGTGVWGETHLLAYSSAPNIRLVCACDKNEKLGRERATQYGAETFTTDYHELLANPEIKAVSIVTPDFLHREIVVAAAEAGKHILIEKPMATTVADCEAMIAAAKANKVTLMVDFHNRFNPAFVALKNQIVAGKMGQPQMMSIRLNDTIYVPTGMLSWSKDSSVLWFLGSHTLDLVRWLFDDEVERVYSISRSRVLKERGLDTPDFFHTICEFKGGGVAHIENCWIMSNAFPTVCDLKCEFVGSEGTALFSVVKSDTVEFYSDNELRPFGSTRGVMFPDTNVVMDIHGKPTGFGVESILYFANCVIEGKAPFIKPEDGLQNTKVLLAALESARVGQPVGIE